MERAENNILPTVKEGESQEPAQTILARMKAYNVTGASVAVFDNNEIVWAKGYGLSNKSTNTAVDTGTIFQAASISKPLASVAACKLVDEGKLSLDEDVNSKLKRYQIPESEFTENEKVTPRHIMSHMAGLSTPGFVGYNRDEELPTLKQVIEGSPPANSDPVKMFQEPGKSESYSGGGMIILQMLMEDVTGEDFSELLSELVLEPAGMDRSTFTSPLPEELESLAARGYLEDGEMVEGGYWVHPELAAAGLWSTPSDLARFMISLGQSYRGKENGMVKPETAKLMLTKIPGTGGLGFGLRGKGDTFRFQHTGRNKGFSCYAVSFGSTGKGMVVMTNADEGLLFNQELTKAISKELEWPDMWLW